MLLVLLLLLSVLYATTIIKQLGTKAIPLFDQVVFDPSDWSLRMFQWLPPARQADIRGQLRKYSFLRCYADLSPDADPSSSSPVQFKVEDEILVAPAVASQEEEEEDSSADPASRRRDPRVSLFRAVGKTLKVEFSDVADTTMDPAAWNSQLRAFVRRETGEEVGGDDGMFGALLGDNDLMLLKFVSSFQIRKGMTLRGLKRPTAADSKGDRSLPIRPGLFKGTYGSHGNELISLSFEKSEDGGDLHKFVGVKVTGDPNVPFGKVSFEGSLDDYLELTAEEQETVQMLSAAAVLERAKASWDQTEGNQARRQPFRCESFFEGWMNRNIEAVLFFLSNYAEFPATATPASPAGAKAATTPGAPLASFACARLPGTTSGTRT